MEENNEYNEIKCTVIEGERLQFVTLDEWLRVEIKHGRITENEVEALRMDGEKYIEVGATVAGVMADIQHINERNEDKETNDVRDAITRALEELDESTWASIMWNRTGDTINVSRHIAYPFPGSRDAEVYEANKAHIGEMIAAHGIVAILGPIETNYSQFNEIRLQQHATVFTAESTDEKKIDELMERRKNLQNAKEVKRLREQLEAMKMKQRAAAFLLGVIDSDDDIDWDIVTAGIDWFDDKNNDCYCCDCCGCDC